MGATDHDLLKMVLAERLREVFALDPSAMALEFEGDDYSWGDLSAVASAIDVELIRLGVVPGDVVGWVALNVPASIAALAALLMSQRCAACINPHMGPVMLTDELRLQRFVAIVAEQSFWEIEGVEQAAKDAGSAALEVAWDGSGWNVSLRPDLEVVGLGPHRQPMPGVALERLSSGTTGPPNRSPVLRDEAVQAIEVGRHSERSTDSEQLVLRRSPAIIFRPLAHGGGSFSVLMALYSGRPISLHRKFSVPLLVDAVARHRPKVVSLVPAMIAMVLDTDVPPEALSCLTAVRCGTAPLPPNMQQQFESKYGVPVLIDYGATEFGGAAGWSLSDHRQFSASKRGSVGRAMKGVELRIVDQTTRDQITDGAVGLLEVKSERKGGMWFSTRDLASLDEDGFLFIHGRADDAIVRGGFKVLPDEVANVLRMHPDVRDAFVVGVPDATLGQVPVGVIETFPGRPAPDEETLKAFARAHLTPYQVPARFKYTDQLPRTVTMKVIRAEVLAIAEAPGD